MKNKRKSTLKFTSRKIYFQEHLSSLPWLVISAFLLFNCSPAEKISTLSTFSDTAMVNCIIEIPAGTNKKIEYSKIEKEFVTDQRDGGDRVISYLPYPGNYGFIAATYSDPAKGGDGDPLDVLVICEALPTGTILEAIPIAVLRLIDNGEADFKVICIPAEKEKRTMDAVTFFEFSYKYPEALSVLESWFRNYDSHDNTHIEGWGDEKEALIEILKTANHKKKDL